MVHAGTSGNEKAVIAAFSLQPTQLRIASIITRAPDGKSLKPRCPELAKIKDGVIVIEPYAPNKL
jgi:septum site-determining protein MinC